MYTEICSFFGVLLGSASNQMKSYIPPFAFMLLILLSSSIPMDTEIRHLEFIMRIDPTWQNALHIPIFGVMAYLFLTAFTKRKWSLGRAVFATVLTTLTYGIIDEFYQAFIPGRYCSLSDSIFNSIGVAGGIAIFLSRNFFKRNQYEDTLSGS
jgi:hypothetical protein